MNRPTAIILLVLAFPLFSWAGSGVSKEDRDLLFLKNHFSLSFNAQYLFLEQETIFGRNDLKVLSRPGFSFGFKHLQNFHKNFAIEAGMEFGMQNFNYQFTLYPGDYDIPFVIDHSETITKPYLNIPLNLNPRFSFGKRNILNFYAGFNVHFYSAIRASGSVSYVKENTTEEVYNMFIEYKKPSPYINVTGGVAYGIILKNLDIINFGVRYNMGGRQLMESTYRFRNDDGVVGKGRFWTDNAYLSFQFSYTFTKAKHMKRKIEAFKSGDTPKPFINSIY